MSVLALWSPVDLMLGVVGPLAAAAAVETALLVDLDQHGPKYGGSHSLADLVAKGPTRSQLEPARTGSAVLRNGGVSPGDAEEVITALVQRWPNVVLRCPAGTEPSTRGIAMLPLLPAPFTPTVPGSVVYQQTNLSPRVPNVAHVLPVPRSATVNALLAGIRPRSNDRWIRAFARVWEI